MHCILHLQIYEASKMSQMLNDKMSEEISFLNISSISGDDLVWYNECLEIIPKIPNNQTLYTSNMTTSLPGHFDHSTEEFCLQLLHFRGSQPSLFSEPVRKAIISVYS